MTQKRLLGKTALVTGASGGLGADFARELAGLGSDLVLVARREEQLLTLQAEITAAHPVRVHVVPADLAATGAPRLLYDRIKAEGLPVDILVIGIGVNSALNVPEETVQELHAHGIADVELHPTHLACARFNELYHQGRRVALLAHGTC